ncbi:MAG: hypothetical protein QOE88_2300, partial [Verrucomicrobiota bacterium]|nr:hypothetical protein [Verrucomicrobiota bacterium]
MHHFLLEGMLLGLFFVHLNTQSGGCRRKPIAILGAELTSDNIPTPWDVRQHIFLDQEVGRGERKMKSHGVRDRSQRIMWGDSHLVGLRHGGDLFGFQKAAAMAEIRLDDMAGPLLENRSELM